MARKTARRERGSEAICVALFIVVLMGTLACGQAEPTTQRHGTTAGNAAGNAVGDISQTLPDNSNRRPRTDMVESLRADLAAVRHPSDGGGRAWLEDSSSATVGTTGRWTLIYEAGPLGIDVGGMVFLQVSPFWGWSTPQTEQPNALGYTEVSSAAGARLEPSTLDQQLLGVRIAGQRLEPGQRIRIVYGAGPAGARADRFAERSSRFWFAVDGDGDGIRQVLGDSPGVDVGPGPPARLVLTLPSTAQPGDRVRLTAAVLDAKGNAGVDVQGEMRLQGTLGEEPLETRDLPRIRFAPGDLGRASINWTVPRETGVLRLRGSLLTGLEGQSNPLQISPRGTKIFWADLQNHSSYSDGSAGPEEHFLYARDVAALDVYALTDHDHWGMIFLDQTPTMWEEIRQLTRQFHNPGSFVTLLGFEWTNWVHGHRHVLYFDSGQNEGQDKKDGILSAIDPAYDHPLKLWRGLAGRKALTIAHHSAGGPISTDWTIAPDSEFEPVTEIISVHGSSEAADSPSLIHRPVAGNFVRDALERGYRFGFLGSSDGHDGHPGLAHFASPTGGLAAILADELTRDAIYEALRARRVYATSGPRIILRTSFSGYRMGADIPLRRSGDPKTEQGETWTVQPGPVEGIPVGTLVVQVIGQTDVERVDVIRSGTVSGLTCGPARQCSFSLDLADPRPGEYLYLRIVQVDGGLAWSSPFYFVD